MKLNIEKFASGGRSHFSAVANPFSSAATAERTAKSDDKDGLISDGVLDALIKNGIPNDVDDFMRELAAMETDINAGLNVSKSKLYGMKAKANRIIQASRYLKTAETEATKNGALDEIAIDLKGYFYTIDEKNKLSKTHISQYEKSDKQALTVGELINYRKYDPDLTGNTDVASVVGTNIGLELIQEYIKGIIQTVGTSSTAADAYVSVASIVGKNASKKPTSAQLHALQGMADLLDTLASTDAIFKENTKESSKNVQEACKYILSVLPNNMKMQLMGKYVAAGASLDEANKDIVNLVGFALDANNTTNYEYSLDYQLDLNKISNPGKAGGSSKTFYQTPNEAFLDGDLNQTVITLTDNAMGNDAFVQLKGVQMPCLTNDNGNALTNLPLGVALLNSLLKYTHKDKMYMGEQKINEGMLNNIAYSGDQVAAVYMPVTSNGDIDWAGFHGFSQALQYIKEQNISDIDQMNMIHARCGSYAHYDRNGNLVSEDKTARYLVTYGYTIDDHVDDDNAMVEELSGREEDDADRLISQLYNKHLKNTTGVSGMANKQGWDDIFKVPIYIRLDDKASGDAYRYGGHGSNMTPKTLQEDMVSEMANQEPAVKIQGSTNLLYQ